MKDAEIVDLYWERNEAAIQQTQQKYGAYLSKPTCREHLFCRPG